VVLAEKDIPQHWGALSKEPISIQLGVLEDCDQQTVESVLVSRDVDAIDADRDHRCDTKSSKLKLVAAQCSELQASHVTALDESVGDENT
jgi:hypothetical protein